MASIFYTYFCHTQYNVYIFKSVTVDGRVPCHALCLIYFSIINTRSAAPALPAERWVHTASVEIVVAPASAVSVRTGTIRAGESGLFGYFCKKPKHGLIGTAAGYCSFSIPFQMKTMMYKVTVVTYSLVVAVDRHFTCMQ